MQIGWRLGDDAEARRALQQALDAGVTFFDTSDIYGWGHSERIVGQVLAAQRDRVVICTKFGNVFDAEAGTATGIDRSPAYVRRACEASLRRLGTEYIDLYLLHFGVDAPDAVLEIRDALERLVDEGKVRTYGWSTDDPAQARLLAAGPHCTAVEANLNVFEDNPALLAVCEESDLAYIVRSPLATGLLSDTYAGGTPLAADDERRAGAWSEYFHASVHAAWVQRVAAVRAVLTEGGRTLAQGALGWVLARSARMVPIPGFTSSAQVAENAGTLRFGPLTDDQMVAVARLLDGLPRPHSATPSAPLGSMQPR
jgi:aryl-alcohol dehydrogenase-like predicted oxidoreductase